MNRQDFESMGDFHKQFEGRNAQYHLSETPIMVRLDGRAFHTFAAGLARPFDERLTMCMVETTKELVKQTNALIGYTQSDEISLILPASIKGEQLFGGRVDKINSVLSGIASAKFMKMVTTHIPEKSEMLPVFDCRSWQYPREELYIDSLIWREADATRNSLTMAASSKFSQKQLQGVGRSGQHDLLHSIGINWNDYPVFFKRGTYIRREKAMKLIDDETWDKIPEKSKPNSRYCVRSEIVAMDMPPIAQVINRDSVVFEGASPVCGK